MLFQNHTAKLGIYVIFTHVTVVPLNGTNGFVKSKNLHLLTFHVNDRMILKVHSFSYICVIPVVTSSIGFSSHQSTVYVLLKYLLIVNVWLASVAVAWMTISRSFVIHTSHVTKRCQSGQPALCAFVHHIGCETKAKRPHSTAHAKIKHLATHFGWFFSLIFFIFCFSIKDIKIFCI